MKDLSVTESILCTGPILSAPRGIRLENLHPLSPKAPIAIDPSSFVFPVYKAAATVSFPRFKNVILSTVRYSGSVRSIEQGTSESPIKLKTFGLALRYWSSSEPIPIPPARSVEVSLLVLTRTDLGFKLGVLIILIAMS